MWRLTDGEDGLYIWSIFFPAGHLRPSVVWLTAHCLPFLNVCVHLQRRIEPIIRHPTCRPPQMIPYLFCLLPCSTITCMT